MTASKTSLGPLSLLDGITMTIAAERGGWTTTFSRGGEKIAEDHGKTYPWLGRYAAGHLTGVLCGAVPLDKKTVKAAIGEVFDTIAQSEDAAALVSEAATRVIGETTAVTVELSDPPAYVIDLDDGKSMIFSAREIAAHTPITLNTKWLTVHPREPLNATGADFETIIAHWLSVAEEGDPAGSANPWEDVVEALQIRIAPLPVHAGKDGLLKSGLWQEQDGPLWIAGRIIREVMKEAGRSEADSGFSKYLQAAGILVCPSKPMRVGRMRVRAWGISPDFRPDDLGIADFATLAAEEVP